MKLEELGKYFLTAAISVITSGAISFITSRVYTEYLLDPKHNVRLVPFSFDMENSALACTVEQNKLAGRIKNIDRSKSTSSLPQPGTYEFYLTQILASNLVLKEYVPDQFLQQLEEEGILSCNQQIPRGNSFTLEAATLFGQPTPYLLKRSCSMLYQGVKIPILVSASPEINSDLAISNTPNIILIRETRRLVFTYDESHADTIAKNKLSELVRRRVGKEDIELSVRCSVIDPYKEIEIGGESYRISAAG